MEYKIIIHFFNLFKLYVLATMKKIVNVKKHRRNGNYVEGHKRIINQTYSDYLASVNMDYKELLKWSKNPCSNKASLNKKPINRNLKLLKKPRSKWTIKDVKEARKTISFNSRMSKVAKGKPVCNGLSKRDIALRNWAKK